MPGSVGQYTQGWLPFQGVKAEVGASTRVNTTSELGMGYYQSAGAQNNSWDVDLWMDTGTWKFCMVNETGTNRGIATVQFNGVSQGTIDQYAASSGVAIYNEITGLSVTTAGVVTVRVIAATKNASSSNYFLLDASHALLRTSGTASTPNGSATPGYTWQYLPWMGSKTATQWATRTQFSGYLGGGVLQSDGGQQNNTIAWDIWGDTGTYKVALIYSTGANYGIHNITGLNGTQTFDGYNAGGASNVYTEVTGITIAAAGTKTLTDTMATKNASSSSYYGFTHSVAVIRTGA